MAINFWEAQRKARKKTALYLFVFTFLTILAAFLAEIAMRTFAYDSYGNPTIPYVGMGFTGIIFLTASLNYVSYLNLGGSYVAKSMGGKRVQPDTRNPKERQLLNIVEEMAVATSLPIPPVYIIDAQEINAFAAGTSSNNTAIAVTIGTLNLLNRDELQGVIGHEFGHVYYRDMKINMRVAAMIMGFFIVSYIGLRLLQGTSYGVGRRISDERNGRKGGNNPIVVAALILIVFGSVMWFFGSILQAMVSRQREYLADASAVQFTRNPWGIANALRKIASTRISDMPASGKPYAHLYFNEHESFWSRIFATHPPVEERIAAIEGGKYRAEEETK